MENNTIILKSNTLRVVNIIKKTKATMFTNLMVGDEVKFSVQLKIAGSNRGNTYATYIKTKNLRTGEITLNSFNQLPKILNKFKFEEIEGTI